MLGRDIGAALACFGREGRLLTADGTEICGREAIGSVLGQLAGAHGGLEIRPGQTILAGEVALCRQSWTLRLEQGAERYERATVASFVLHLLDGRWQIMVAEPWGGPPG
jgi:ketosteroid isomerase-like protein